MAKKGSGSGTRKTSTTAGRTTAGKGAARPTAEKPPWSEPVRKAPSAPASQEPSISCESFVNAHGRSPALKRYLLRHYGSAAKTATEWQKIVDGLKTREVS